MKLYPKLSLVFIVLMLSCDDKSPVGNTTTGFIDPELTDYVNRFVQEGKSRNVVIDTRNLTLEFSSTTPNGSCESIITIIAGGSPHAQLLKTDGCWNKNSDLDKEILVFHALGHVLLNRSHDASLLPSGRQKTIMNPTYIFGIYIKTAPDLRTYYLDELFNSKTPTPSWALPKTNSKEIYSDSIDVNTAWLFYKSFPSGTQTGTVSATNFLSKGHALSIESTQVATSDQSSFWTKVLTADGIAVGTEVSFKVKIKTVGVTPNANVYLAIAAFSGSDQAVYKNTLGLVSIPGTQDYTEYSITITYFPDQINSIVLYMVMGPSTGKVYFDDIKVVNNY